MLVWGGVECIEWVRKSFDCFNFFWRGDWLDFLTLIWIGVYGFDSHHKHLHHQNGTITITSTVNPPFPCSVPCGVFGRCGDKGLAWW